MATWKQCSGEPVTVEPCVRVFDVDNPDREGLVSVFRGVGGIKLGTCVYMEHCTYDKDGCVIDERHEVLDRSPVFA